MQSQPKPLDSKAIFPDNVIIFDGEKLRLWLQDKSRLDPNILTALRERLNDALKQKEIKEETHQAQITLLDNQLLGVAAFTAVPERKVKESDYEAIYGGKTVLRVFPRKVLDEKKAAEQQDAKLKTSRLNKIEAFQKQFYELLDQLNRWGVGQYKDQMAWLKENIFKELYSGTQDNDYFALVKKYFERIYLLLKNENLSSDIAKQVYTDLFSEINVVCSPGLPGHVETALNRLESYLNISLERWLAECRTNAIKYYAMKWNAEHYKNQESMRLGYDTHTESGFLKYARTKGWNPLSDPVREQDQYVIKLSEEKYQPFLTQIDEDYNPSDASNFIHGKLNELVNIQKTLQELKEDQDHWVPYKLKFYKTLEDYTQSLLGRGAEVSELFALDEKGRINTKLNESYLYQKIMEECRAKHIFLDTLDKHMIKLGARFFLKKHYLPLPPNAKAEPDKTNRWTGLSDDYLIAFTNYAVKQCQEAKTNFPIEFADHLIESAMFTGKSKAFRCLLENKITSHDDKKSEIVQVNNKPYFSHYFLGKEVMKNWDRLSDDDALGMFEVLKNRDREFLKEWPSIDYLEQIADCCARTNKPKLFNRLVQESSDLVRIFFLKSLIAKAIKHGSVTIAKQMMDRVKNIGDLQTINPSKLAVEANQPEILRYFNSRAEGFLVVEVEDLAKVAAQKDHVEMVEPIIESIRKLVNKEDQEDELEEAIEQWIVAEKPRFLEKLADMKMDIKLYIKNIAGYGNIIGCPKSVQVLIERNMLSEQQVYQLIETTLKQEANQTLDVIFAAMKQIDWAMIKKIKGKPCIGVLFPENVRIILKYKDKIKSSQKDQKESDEKGMVEYMYLHSSRQLDVFKILCDAEIPFRENANSVVSSDIIYNLRETFSYMRVPGMWDAFFKFIKNEKNINLNDDYVGSLLGILTHKMLSFGGTYTMEIAEHETLIRALMRNPFHSIDPVIRGSKKKELEKNMTNGRYGHPVWPNKTDVEEAIVMLADHSLTRAAFFPAEYEYKVMSDGSRQYIMDALDSEIASIRTNLIDEKHRLHFKTAERGKIFKHHAYQLGWNPQPYDPSSMGNDYLTYLNNKANHIELNRFMCELEKAYTPTYLIEKMIDRIKTFANAEVKAGTNEDAIKKKLEAKFKNDYRMVIDKDKIFTRINDAKGENAAKSVEFNENYLYQAMLTNLCKMNVFDEKSVEQNSIKIGNQTYFFEDFAFSSRDNEHRWKALPEQTAAMMADELLATIELVDKVEDSVGYQRSAVKLKLLIAHMLHYQVDELALIKWFSRIVQFILNTIPDGPELVSMLEVCTKAQLEFSAYTTKADYLNRTLITQEDCAFEKQKLLGHAVIHKFRAMLTPGNEDDKAVAAHRACFSGRAGLFYRNLNTDASRQVDKIMTDIRNQCGKKRYVRNLDMKSDKINPFVVAYLIKNKTPDDSFEKMVYRLITDKKEVKINELELLYLMLSAIAELPMVWAKRKLEKQELSDDYFFVLERLVKYRDINPDLSKEAKKIEYEKQFYKAFPKGFGPSKAQEALRDKFNKLVAFDELEKSIDAIVMQYPEKSR